jgi:hypothetical protein
MILFFNNKITDVRRPGTVLPYRPNLNDDNRFDIARYTFASHAALDPLVSKYVFYLSIEDGFANRKDEMEEWLRSVFPKDKLIIHWHRCNHINQWREAAKEFEDIDDPLIYPVGNDDHVFIDSSLSVLKSVMDLMINDPDPLAVLTVSHYPESMRYGPMHGATLTPCGNAIVYPYFTNDAIRIIKRDFFAWHLVAFDDDRLCFRTEDWGFEYPVSKVYCPTKEIFRHFDGYEHVKIDVNRVPPLEIPKGFFQRDMHIRYGFSEIDSTAVNINPTIPSKTEDITNGVDYRFVLEDMPMFWKPYISKIDIADNIDNISMANARDKNFRDVLNAKLASHIGTYTDANLAPQHWIKNHMITDLLN